MQWLNTCRQRTCILLHTVGQEKTVDSHVIKGLIVSSLERDDFNELLEAIVRPCNQAEYSQARGR